MFRLIIQACVVLFPIFVLAQIEVDDSGSTSAPAEEVSTGSSKMAIDGLDFREQRKVGVGLDAAGTTGIMGINLELNFSPDVSFVGGFGLGSDFQTVNLKIKKVLTGTWFLPYVSGGISRWYSVGDNDNVGETTPSFFRKKMLSKTERRSGDFAETLVFPGFGIQYVQLNGEWAGASAYAEVVMLVDVDDLVAVPTGGIGLAYYF